MRVWHVKRFVVLNYTLGVKGGFRKVVGVLNDIDNAVDYVTGPAAVAHRGRSSTISVVRFHKPQAQLFFAFGASTINLRIHITSVYVDSFWERLVIIEDWCECRMYILAQLFFSVFTFWNGTTVYDYDKSFTWHYALYKSMAAYKG